jgi:hypothetical protein
MSTSDLDPTISTPVRGAESGVAALGLRGTERRAGLRSALLGASRPAVDVAVRSATDADRAALAHLASLDGGRVPGAPLLLAERAGVAVAAIGILDRRVIADPSADATAAIDRLQALAAEQRGPVRRRRWAARLRRGTTGRRAAASTRRSDAAVG